MVWLGGIGIFPSTQRRHCDEFSRSGTGRVYRGEIPGQAGGVVEYTVSARDFAGNTGTGAAQSFVVSFGTIFADGFESGDLSAWSGSSG